MRGEEEKDRKGMDHLTPHFFGTSFVEKEP